MNEAVMSKLKEAGFTCEPKGCYSQLPSIVENGIDTVKMFGWSHWEKSTSCGVVIKKIVRELSSN